MYRKRTRVVFLIVLTITLITACSPPTLEDINCQPDDVNSEPPFIRLAEDTIVPANAPFPDLMTGYSRVALTENQLTNTDALCTIRTFDSADLAAEALKLLCLQSQGDPTQDQAGDNACGFQNEGIRELHFQQGTAVVTIREDSGGSHVVQWAEAVNGRLAK